MGLAPVSGWAYNSHESLKVIASFFPEISNDPMGTEIVVSPRAGGVTDAAFC